MNSSLPANLARQIGRFTAWALGVVVVSAASAQSIPAAAAAPSAGPAAVAENARSAPRMPTPVSPRSAKLLLTGGVSSIDGAAGGGLTPWAVIGSYASRGGVGGSVFITHLSVPDYRLTVTGALLAWDDRVELSIARQDFATGDSIAPLGFPGLNLRQDIVGLKWRVAGEAILDSDRWMPQIALGVEQHRLEAGDFAPVLRSLGARLSDNEVYLSATKLFLGQSVLVNGTLRRTRANQNGLLGFGSTKDNRRRIQPEVSVALLLRRDLAAGLEYRAKPDHLNGVAFGNGLREDDWKDLFVAWTPSKQLSLTLAWVDLGVVLPALTPRRQSGAYISAQVAF
jgi:hypothetical protein